MVRATMAALAVLAASLAMTATAQVTYDLGGTGFRTPYDNDKKKHDFNKPYGSASDFNKPGRTRTWEEKDPYRKDDAEDGYGSGGGALDKDRKCPSWKVC